MQQLVEAGGSQGPGSDAWTSTADALDVAFESSCLLTATTNSNGQGYLGLLGPTLLSYAAAEDDSVR